MAEPDESTPIIIKKIKKGEGHHGGAWKVAYADFVTAMMALFIVLWVLAQNDEVKQGIAGYFQDPLGFSDKTGALIGGPNDGSLQPGVNIDAQLQKMEKEKLEQMGKKIINDISSNSDFMDLADQIQVEFVDEGMRIEMLEAADDVFFTIGSSALNPKSEKILIQIGKELSKINNNVVVEGHTDSRPFVSGRKDYTNYELSADRANAARRALIKGGLNIDNVSEIRGYADKMLRDKSNPYSVSNRRISIIVKYSKQDEKANNNS